MRQAAERLGVTTAIHTAEPPGRWPAEDAQDFLHNLFAYSPEGLCQKRPSSLMEMILLPRLSILDVWSRSSR